MSRITYLPVGSPSPAALLDLIQEELKQVEQRLSQEIISPVKRLAELGQHVLQAGGKRLRPALVILSAKAAAGEEPRTPFPDSERLIPVAACMELIHMATLIHDDVVDATLTRRGVPTANVLFGNTATVLTGDYLLAKAMRLLAIDGDLRIIRKVSNVTIEMSEGEVLQVFLRRQLPIPEAQYFEVIRKKTAVFLSGCGGVGALLADAGAEIIAALEDYGYHLGMAFQIVDDLLDYLGDPKVTGKPVGTDFRDGCATLPLLHLYEHAEPAFQTRLQQTFGTPISEAELDEYIQAMEANGSFDYARQVAVEHAHRALGALEALPASDARQVLESVAPFVVQRTR